MIGYVVNGRSRYLLEQILTLLTDRHQIGLPSDFIRRFVVAIDVAVSCRPAGVKPTETIAFAIVAWWRSARSVQISRESENSRGQLFLLCSDGIQIGYQIVHSGFAQFVQRRNVSFVNSISIWKCLHRSCHTFFSQ